VRSEGIEVQVDTIDYPILCIQCPDASGPGPACDANDACTQVTLARIEVTFEGYLLVIAPPSDR
jgi:hypothetical protein